VLSLIVRGFSSKQVAAKLGITFKTVATHRTHLMEELGVHEKCGKAYCACASDPTKRHGPYYEITYKANGKTVNVKLSPEATPLYKAASQQYRKLKTLLNRLEKLSQTILRYQAKLVQSRHRT
jgi:hypothetical protein